MTASGAAAAAIANVTKASGVIVKVDTGAFQTILRQIGEPLVAHAEAGFFSTKHKYLTSYKGLAFYAKASEQLRLPAGAEVVDAKKIWVPN